ncbi:hypothetical protein PBY51_004495 [Eleginops maclovinus]|uniref:Uncharacterized protein n=1 Tax=Eleginops maclovinus TaxID=56733 RepID=A0AAN8AX73_ELEMC|nr:hypothetical protein PBY51_004495 [Eleginops maclovinus]
MNGESGGGGGMGGALSCCSSSLTLTSLVAARCSLWTLYSILNPSAAPPPGFMQHNATAVKALSHDGSTHGENVDL